MLEWLKAILGDTYTEEIDKKVSDKVGKDFRPATDFNAVNEEKKALAAQVAERDKQLEDLKKSAGNADELQKKIADLQAENKTKDKEHDAQLKKLQMDFALEAKLSGAKSKNNKAVRALLDEAKISLDGGNILGLDEQLIELKKANPYLFDEEQKTPIRTGLPIGGGAPAPGGEAKPDMGAAITEAMFPKV